MSDPYDCESHRPPQGPNEYLAQCFLCWGITYAMRPENESFGWHTLDCSLPLRHESYCKPGGFGHARPEGMKIRG